MVRAINIPRAQAPPYVQVETFDARFGELIEIRDCVKRTTGITNFLEVSSKSNVPLGKQLSAFNLKAYAPVGTQSTVECFYQGSKVFENGGPYQDLYWKTSREAKVDKRLKKSGKLIGFQYGTRKMPLDPSGAFYNWLYCNSLRKLPNILEQLRQYQGFTDVFYDPRFGNNCQSFACALFVATDGLKNISVSEALSHQDNSFHFANQD